MNRLLFEKTDDAVYLSHLDLMRVFQRAFKRADIMIWHSQGFSPRASARRASAKFWTLKFRTALSTLQSSRSC